MIIDAKKCGYCKACILICENKALIYEELNDRAIIHINQDLCTGDCIKCKDVCSYNSINLDKSDIKKCDIPYSRCKNCGKNDNSVNKQENSLCIECKRKLSIQKVYQNINI